jgi:hypothetical protein
MRATLPPAPPNYDPGYFTRALSEISRFLGEAVTRFEAAPSLLLQSPGGKVYKLTVDDAGVVTTEEVPLGQSGSAPY